MFLKSPGSVQFISPSRPSTEYLIRNTGTGSDGRCCHLSHCPHKFMQNNKIQMKYHSEKKNKCKYHQRRCTKLTTPHVEQFDAWWIVLCALCQACTTQKSWRAKLININSPAGSKSLFRCRVEEILKGNQLCEVGLLQHFLQLRKISGATCGPRTLCCAGLLCAHWCFSTSLGMIVT